MIIGNLDQIVGRSVAGWSWDPERPTVRQTIRILVDGEPVVCQEADRFRPDLLDAGIGDGFHSYSLLLPIQVMDGGEHLIEVVAGDGVQLHGSPKRMVLPNLGFVPLPESDNAFTEELAICAIAKDEARYLVEWIAYHRVVGVERFVIFDNESSDGTSELLERFARQGFLERIPWPSVEGEPPQLTAYAEGLSRLRGRSRWIAYIDLDEFLLPLDGDDVRAILRDYRDVAGLVVPWRIFGSNGLRDWRDDLVIRRFTRRATEDHPVNTHVKSIVQGLYQQDVGIHAAKVNAGSLADEHRVVVGTASEPDRHPVPGAHRLVLNHYFCKSWEEWTVKQNRGMADRAKGQVTHRRPEGAFHGHDLNDIADERILRFEAAVRAEMARLLGAA